MRAVVLAAVALGGGEAIGADETTRQPPQLLSSEPIRTTLRNNRAWVTVFVAGGSQDETLSFRGLLRGRDGRPEPATFAVEGTDAVKKWTASGFTLRIDVPSGNGGSGVVVVGGGDPAWAPLPIALTVEPETPPPSRRGALVAYVGLALSIVVVGVAWRSTRASLRTPLGLPKWDPAGSWVSNFTIAAAVLTALLNETWLPAETRNLGRREYAALAFLCGMLVALAPIVYNASRRRDEAEGRVWSFLLASALTLWAGSTQMGLVVMLVDEARAAAVLTAAVVHLFLVTIAGAALALVVYAFQTVRGILGSTTAGAARRALPALPRWPLL